MIGVTFSFFLCMKNDRHLLNGRISQVNFSLIKFQETHPSSYRGSSFAFASWTPVLPPKPPPTSPSGWKLLGHLTITEPRSPSLLEPDCTRVHRRSLSVFTNALASGEVLRLRLGVCLICEGRGQFITGVPGKELEEQGRLYNSGQSRCRGIIVVQQETPWRS